MQLFVVNLWTETKESIDDINISDFTGQLQQTEYLALHEIHDTWYIASYVRNIKEYNEIGQERPENELTTQN
jgi:hypothetical protein